MLFGTERTFRCFWCMYDVCMMFWQRQYDPIPWNFLIHRHKFACPEGTPHSYSQKLGDMRKLFNFLSDGARAGARWIKPLHVPDYTAAYLSSDHCVNKTQAFAIITALHTISKLQGFFGHPTGHTTLLRHWINVIDVDSMSQNQRHWRWFDVATTSYAQWDVSINTHSDKP